MSITKQEQARYEEVKKAVLESLFKDFNPKDMVFYEDSHTYFMVNDELIKQTFSSDELKDLEGCGALKIDKKTGKMLLEMKSLSSVLATIHNHFYFEVVLPEYVFKNMNGNATCAKDNVIAIVDILGDNIKKIHKENNGFLYQKEIEKPFGESFYNKIGNFSKFKLFNDIFGFNIYEKEKLISLDVDVAKEKIHNFLEKYYDEMNNYGYDDFKFVDIELKLKKLEKYPEKYKLSINELGMEDPIKIRNCWAIGNIEATTKGSIIHNILEDKLNGKKWNKNTRYKYYKMIDLNNIVRQLKSKPEYIETSPGQAMIDAVKIKNGAKALIRESLSNIENIFNQLMDAGYRPITTEFRVFDVSAALAGTFDILLYDTKNDAILIGDWKTNIKLDQNNVHQNLINDVQEFFLTDTNFNVYSFQVSAYMTLLSQGANFSKTVDDLGVKISDKHLILHVNQTTSQAYKSFENVLISETKLKSFDAGEKIIGIAKKELAKRIDESKLNIIPLDKLEIEHLKNDKINLKKVDKSKEMVL